MWEKQPLIAGMESAVQDGTTSTFTFGMSKSRAVVEHECTSNRLRLSVTVGACEWSSEWLDLSSQLRSPDTVPLILEAARHLQVLASLRSSGRGSGLTPLELACLSYQTYEHLLA